MANYPNSKDSFTPKTALVDLIRAEHINTLQDVARAIEDAIGTVQGGDGTMKFPMGATVVVAASDSKNKAGAHYVCDGTDDQEEIQAAINALPATGGAVLLLDGTFSIKAGQLVIGDNVTLMGMGASTVLKRGSSDAGAMVRITGKKAAVRNLLVDTNPSLGATSELEGIEVRDSQDFLIENIFVTGGNPAGSGLSGDGIYINGSQRGIVKGCVVYDWEEGSAIELAHGTSRVTDIEISECIMFNCAGGLTIHNHSDTPAPARVTVVNCAAIQCGPGFDAVGASGAPAQPEDISFIGCVASSNTNYGFKVHVLAERVIIANCIAMNNGEQGILVQHGNHRAIVTGCIARGNSGGQIQADSAVVTGCYAVGETGEQGVIAGKVIDGCTIVGGSRGIVMSNDMVVSNCYIRDCTEYGIYADSVSDIVVNSNNFYGNARDLYINGLTRAKITNNRLALIDWGTSPNTQLLLKGNTGFNTSQSGVATIPAGSSSVTVSHSVRWPVGVVVAPAGDARVWVSSVTDTEFTIQADAAVGSDLPVYWIAFTREYAP